MIAVAIAITISAVVISIRNFAFDTQVTVRDREMAGVLNIKGEKLLDRLN